MKILILILPLILFVIINNITNNYCIEIYTFLVLILAPCIAPCIQGYNWVDNTYSIEDDFDLIYECFYDYFCNIFPILDYPINYIINNLGLDVVTISILISILIKCFKNKIFNIIKNLLNYILFNLYRLKFILNNMILYIKLNNLKQILNYIDTKKIFTCFILATILVNLDPNEIINIIGDGNPLEFGEVLIKVDPSISSYLTSETVNISISENIIANDPYIDVMKPRQTIELGQNAVECWVKNTTLAIQNTNFNVSYEFSKALEILGNSSKYSSTIVEGSGTNLVINSPLEAIVLNDTFIFIILIACFSFILLLFKNKLWLILKNNYIKLMFSALTLSLPDFDTSLDDEKTPTISNPFSNRLNENLTPSDSILSGETLINEELSANQMINNLRSQMNNLTKTINNKKNLLATLDELNEIRNNWSDSESETSIYPNTTTSSNYEASISNNNSVENISNSNNKNNYFYYQDAIGNKTYYNTLEELENRIALENKPFKEKEKLSFIERFTKLIFKGTKNNLIFELNNNYSLIENYNYYIISLFVLFSILLFILFLTFWFKPKNRTPFITFSTNVNFKKLSYFLKFYKLHLLIITNIFSVFFSFILFSDILTNIFKNLTNNIINISDTEINYDLNYDSNIEKINENKEKLIENYNENNKDVTLNKLEKNWSNYYIAGAIILVTITLGILVYNYYTNLTLDSTLNNELCFTQSQIIDTLTEISSIQSDLAYNFKHRVSSSLINQSYLETLNRDTLYKLIGKDELIKNLNNKIEILSSDNIFLSVRCKDLINHNNILKNEVQRLQNTIDILEI